MEKQPYDIPYKNKFKRFQESSSTSHSYLDPQKVLWAFLTTGVKG